jgi:hypothetical protein
MRFVYDILTIDSAMLSIVRNALPNVGDHLFGSSAA